MWGLFGCFFAQGSHFELVVRKRVQLGKFTVDPFAVQDKSHSRNFHFYENLRLIWPRWFISNMVQSKNMHNGRWCLKGEGRGMKVKERGKNTI